MELLGEIHRLAGRLGSPQDLIAPGAMPLPREMLRGRGAAALQEFLETYCSQILVPHELPAIHQAYLHASRYEVRELIESDWKLSQQPELRRFAGVSQCLGTAQLQKLRPLRDQRLVRRYWEAVENGEAHGWHTVVYGLVLALFSLPLRQGLLHYGQQVIRGFIESGGGAFKQSSEQSAALYASVCAPLPQAIERLLCAEAVVFAK
jgi:urease accessory protein UreF